MLSVFLRDRTAFLLLMVGTASFKLWLSGFAPATDSLREMLRFVGVSSSLGPWIALDALIYGLWRSVTLSNATAAIWWATPPTAMSSDLRLLSLLLRLPSFVFDVGIAITLYLLVRERATTRQARLVSLLWFLNPYGILAIEMLGVPDVAVSFLTVLAVAFFHKKRILLGSVCIAAGIGIKLYPILLLPPILFYCRRELEIQRRSRLALVCLSFLGLAGYLTWVFQLGSALVIYVLTEYTPVTQPTGALFEYIMATRISPAAVALVLLYFVVWLLGRTHQITDLILPVFLVYLTFSNSYPQYYVWAMPFLMLDIVLLKRHHLSLLSALVALVLGSWFISSKGFLTPSGYSLLLIPLQGSNLPWYSQAVRSFLESSATNSLLTPLLHAALGATTFIYAIEIIRFWFRQTTKESEPFH